MARTNRILQEIAALRAELAGAATAAAQAPDTAGSPRESPPLPDEVAALVAAARERVEEGAAEIEAFAEEHPLAVTAAAFLVGVVVGRIWRGR